MTAVLSSRIMEFTDSSIQHVGLLKQEHVATQSCASSAWGEQDAKPTGNKRRVSTGSHEGPQSEQDAFPPQKIIKAEPKDDYELAEEECAPPHLRAESSFISERWKYEGNQSASPVFERTPSFVVNECHPLNDNCNQCVINEARPSEDNISLHRHRQSRESEQGGEEPLSNKIRVWKEKRLEKSQVVRGIPRTPLPVEDDAFFQTIQSRVNPEHCDQTSSEHHLSRDDIREHHVINHTCSVAQHEQRVMSTEQRMLTNEHLLTPRSHTSSSESGRDGYIRYLLTHNSTVGQTIVSNTDAELQKTSATLSPVNHPITIAATSVPVPVVLTSPRIVTTEYMNVFPTSVYPGVTMPHTQTSPAKAPSKVAKKRSRQQTSGSNFLERLGKGRHDSPTLADAHKNKVNETSANRELYLENLHQGQFGHGYTIVPHMVPPMETEDPLPGEQYISDIQRPYCNIPDDHQVTHINGVMSLPATRETRYGITLGELKRRTGFPEYLTRVDLIAYVRQSKSAGRALLDKYNIATAGQKSRPTILSKMCENEARVLGDGICRMNTEYFPWKTLAKVASNKVTEGKNDGKVEHKLKAIQNTRTMLKEIYDLTVENKDINCMKTFEIASHTFGTANILNHLTVFDRLFAEYQNNLIRSEKL